MSIRLSVRDPSRSRSAPHWDYRREYERWEWVHNGCWLVGQSAWLLVPFLLGVSFIPCMSVVATALVTAHGFAHLIGVRGLNRGIADLSFEEGDPVALVSLGLKLSILHAVVAALAFLSLAGVCAAKVALGPMHLALPAVAVATALGAITALRVAGIALADSLGIRSALFLEQAGTAVTVGATALWLLAVALLLAANVIPFGGYLVVAAVPMAAIAVLAALTFHRDLYLRLAVAVPQLAAFNVAAERAERAGPLLLPTPATTPDEDLPPIELAELPAPPPSPGASPARRDPDGSR